MNEYELTAEAIDFDASEPTNLNPGDLDIHDDAMTDGFYVSGPTDYGFEWHHGLDTFEAVFGA